MKKFVLSLAALCFVLAGTQAQRGVTLGSLTRQQQDSLFLAFPCCTSGTVYYKDGSFPSAKLNYDYYQAKALYYNTQPEFDGDSIRLLDLANVFMIKIADRVFVPAMGGLGELILNNKVSLVQAKKVNILEKKTGAYGTSGSTSSIQNVSGITGSNGTSSVSGTYNGMSTFANIRYNFADNSEVSVEYRLFLYKDRKTYPVTKKNLLKLFPKAADFLNRYFAEQNPDWDDVDQMLDLVNLANANNK